MTNTTNSTQTRYCIRYTDTGMVIGDAASSDAAWAEAREMARQGAGHTRDQDEGLDEDAVEVIEYDPGQQRVEMSGGIVQLVETDTE